jgi:hypothetical protein
VRTNEKYDFSKFEEYINDGYFDEALKCLRKMQIHYLELAVKHAVRCLADTLETVEAITEEPKPAKKNPKTVKRSSDGVVNGIYFSEESLCFDKKIEFELIKEDDKIRDDSLIFIYGLKESKDGAFTKKIKNEIGFVMSREQASELHEFLGYILEQTSEASE